MYWPDIAEVPFVPAPGSPLTVTYKSVMPFAEYIIRKMVVAHVSQKFASGQGQRQHIGSGGQGEGADNTSRNCYIIILVYCIT